MQDVIYNHLIPLAPIEFLGVSKYSRVVALEWIYSIKTTCDRDIFWIIVRLLYISHQYDDILLFTNRNFHNKIFKINVKQLFKNGENNKIYSYYRYITYFNGITQDYMIKLAIKIVPYHHLENVFKYAEAEDIKNNTKLSDELDELFWQPSEIFDDDMWESDKAKCVIGLVIKYFPNIITDYIESYANFDTKEPANNSRRCMILSICLIGDMIDEHYKRQASLNVWSRQICGWVHPEMREYFDTKIKCSWEAQRKSIPMGMKYDLRDQ